MNNKKTYEELVHKEFLEPCPFCGKHDFALVNKTDMTGKVVPTIFCPRCKVHFYGTSDVYDSLKKDKSKKYTEKELYQKSYERLLKTWNQRK